MAAEPDSDADVEQQIDDLRPLLTRALHAVMPQLPLVDCARMANEALDDAERGSLDLARAARAFLDGVLNANKRN